MRCIWAGRKEKMKMAHFFDCRFRAELYTRSSWITCSWLLTTSLTWTGRELVRNIQVISLAGLYPPIHRIEEHDQALWRDNSLITLWLELKANFEVSLLEYYISLYDWYLLCQTTWKYHHNCRAWQGSWCRNGRLIWNWIVPCQSLLPLAAWMSKIDRTIHLKSMKAPGCFSQQILRCPMMVSETTGSQRPC